ncbi:hypothetical protein AB0O76_14620 [Streptomyces sp. NPDC086554]|uniref:hypothetical protein n=1 Tax=Streptomyces sp. NPDC086554 TaxID=3154864 RepID=UPI0034135E71
MLLLATGRLLGGPVGVGTVCFLAGVGLLIQPLIELNSGALRISNLGLPPRVPAPPGTADV